MGLDGMTGLIPTVVGAGVVMKITDQMMGPNSSTGRQMGRHGPMEDEYDYNDRRRPVRKNRYTKKTKAGKVTPRRLSGPSGPASLSGIMRSEGRKLGGMVNSENVKMRGGSLGTLPGIGKITPGRLSDLGTDSGIYRQAGREMNGSRKVAARPIRKGSRGFMPY